LTKNKFKTIIEMAMAAPQLTRSLSVNSEERETALLQWITDRCNSMEPIGLEEGWQKIKECGIDILEMVLTIGRKGRMKASEIKLSHSMAVNDKSVQEMQKKREAKPFGCKGYSSLYTISYRMCSHAGNMDWSNQLYERYGTTIKDFLRSHVLSSLTDQHDEYLLQAFRLAWSNHKVMVKWMYRLFMHLDRGLVQNNNLSTLTSVGLKLFCEEIFNSTCSRLQAATVKLINRERNGEDVDQEMLKDIVEVFLVMGVAASNRTLTKVEDAGEPKIQDVQVYELQLEAALLSATREYYQIRGQEWLEGDSVPGYLVKAEHALEEESRRSRRYFHPNTEAKIILALEEELLMKHRDNLLTRESSGAKALLLQDQTTDLERMFRLFSRIKDGLQAMSLIFREHVREMGYRLIQERKSQVDQLETEGKKESAQDPELVQGILDMYERMKLMVETLFSDNLVFHKALKEAFTDFVNSDTGKYSVTEMLCSYCDRLLKNSEKLSEQQMEEKLDSCMKVFVYITDKDMFAEIYRDHLSKRLLNKRSFSNEAEKNMIAKMKMQCGAPFTAKLEGMVVDFNVGEDLYREFGDFFQKIKTDNNLSVDFSVQVLTTGHWPAQKMRELTVPNDLGICLRAFNDWYINKNNMRRLNWVHTLGEATVLGTFKGGKRYDLVLTTLQALSLVVFSGIKEGLSFEEFKERINLDPDISKKVLHSLSCGKFKVLLKSTEGTKINVTDSFVPNESFSNKLRKFRIPMASLEEVCYSRTVQEDRIFSIEAAIVRVMKARRELKHTDLINEVIHQLRNFQPNSRAIKQRIEALIEREYLERHETDANVYRYLA